MKHPLLTASFCLWASRILAAGPTDPPTHQPIPVYDYDRHHDESSNRPTLDYLLLAYDIADVFIHENVMNLEHDDNKRCMFVKTEEGIYSYTSPASSDPTVVCGLYIVADPSQLVEFQFMEFSVSCPDGGLVSLIDGWELNGQFFPSEADHELPRDKRYMEFCGAVPPVTRYITAQNVGLIEFRIPISGQGFRVRVKFHDNPKPCNVVIQFPNGPYTIQNFGRRINCSVSILFPSTLTLTSMSIAIPDTEDAGLDSRSEERQHRPERECSSRGLLDYVEIRGGRELDPLFMAKYNDYCGLFSSEEQGVSPSVQRPRVDVGCGNTVMRLVSSGTQENSVSFHLELFFDTQSSPCPHRKSENAG